MKQHAVLTAFLVLILATTDGMARVKLITLPTRQRVEVQLDHPNATLVEEERIVPLVMGVNEVDFSWVGTTIDPGTIVFRVLGPIEGRNLDVKVLSVSYPPGENSLLWQIFSSNSGSVRVRISYLLSGLEKGFNYRAVVKHDESALTLSQFIRVKNFAGEWFGDSSIHAGYGGHFTKPIGLNETKEMLLEKVSQIPVVKTYTAGAAVFGYLDQSKGKLNVPMHYVIINDSAHNLGQTPLPQGKVRIFQKDAADTTAFLGEDWGQFTPIDEQMRLYLGLAQDVTVRRTIGRQEHHRVAGNLKHLDVVVKYEIENFKDSEITLRIVEDLNRLGQEAGRGGGGRGIEWVLAESTTFDRLETVETNAQQLTLLADLPARKGTKGTKIVHELHIQFRNEW